MTLVEQRRADMAAVEILSQAANLVQAADDIVLRSKAFRLSYLVHAIQHLARPERAVYPKLRRRPKGGPGSDRAWLDKWQAES